MPGGFVIMTNPLAVYGPKESVDSRYITVGKFFNNA